MKRVAIIVIALLLLVFGGVAFAVFAMPAFAQGFLGGDPNANQWGFGRGMMANCPMMGGAGQPGGFAPLTSPTPIPVAPNASTPVVPTPQPTARAGASPTPQPTASAPSANNATQKAGNWNVTLALTPYPPVSFQTTTFDITITDERGNAISDAQVSLDLTMPSMWMPSNKPQAQSLGAGRYQAAGRFTMRGAWQIAVIVQRGAEKQTAYFRVGL